MVRTGQGAVVVGVTGEGRETGALRFAAECALRDDAEVVLAHAYGTTVPPTPPGVLLTYAQAAAVARAVVHEAEQELARLGRGEVKHRVVTAAVTPSHLLVELGREARLVVVQHRDPTRLGRLFVGSTANGAAAHCDCPVVSVPVDWGPPSAPAGDVLVGVHEDGSPLAAVSAGFAWAAATGVALHVVHAWRLDGAYDDIVSARVADEWRAEQLQALGSAVLDLRRDDPSVSVELEVRHQWPAQALVDDSRTASLVVVGRHARHGQPTHHLGSVPRTVLREARSPVMVVPPG